MPSTKSITVSATPVSTLQVEVQEGPDAPKTLKADRDKISIGTAAGNSLVLTDTTVSRYHVELLARPDGVHVKDLDSTNGIVSAGIRVNHAIVKPGTALQIGETKIKITEGDPATVHLLDSNTIGGILGNAAVMRRLMAVIQQTAGIDSSTLIVGESGTGKELIARALHQEGERAAGPFETVDCAGLPPALIASELFGHEKGAFTGAGKQHVGAFERADGGTVFLDEIGELPEALQGTLLGVLERRRFRRVGGQKEISVDVRVVSATNRDLRSEVNQGTFRLDLFHRLAVVVVDVPPLRDRAEDIPMLVEHFLREVGHDGPVDALLPRKAVDALAKHHWPGNVRELRNMIEATVALGEQPPFQDLGSAPSGGDDPIGELLGQPYKKARQSLLTNFESRYLGWLMDEAGGNVSKAARIAKMDRSHLTDLLRRHNLK